MRIACVLVLGFGVSCSSKSEVIMVRDVASAKAAIGKMIEVEGVAQNAKLGAIVDGPELMVYCLDRPEWPSDLVGKTVKVRGTLEVTDQFKATTTPEGGHVAGTMGGDYVFRKSELLTQ